ncbi:hypothetical protein [Actinoplanes sp. NPDC048796]|uniref:hypothetical protein n=1 Tax=unclassified Actinoplanes TaxID=2626549 RepID=UPI0033DBABAB
MNRGEVWRSTLDDEWPVLLLSDDLDVIQVVAPATEAQKRGYTLLSPAEAERERPAGLAGIEVLLDLSPAGAIRVALPHDTHIFCTWRTALTPDALTEYVGTLPPEKMEEIDLAIRLSLGQRRNGPVTQ